MPTFRPSRPSLPGLVVHADWGCQADKRQMAIAVRDDGYYRLLPPEPVGDLWEPETIDGDLKDRTVAFARRLTT